MIHIDTKNQTCLYDNIDTVIKDVIELDNENIEYSINFENNHYYKCVDCLYLFVAKTDVNMSCPECGGELWRVL